MKSLLLALVLGGGPLFATAQAPAVLIEACNSIADADRRLECLKAAMGQPAAGADVTAIVRAFTAMESNLNVGIAYNNYQQALLELGREVAQFSRDAPTQRADAVYELQRSLEAYKDAGVFWESAIRFYARRDNGIAYFGGLPMRMVGLESLIPKYSLPTRKADLLGINIGVPTDLGRSTIWAKAKESSQRGLDLLKPPAREGGAAASIEEKNAEAQRIP